MTLNAIVGSRIMSRLAPRRGMCSMLDNTGSVARDMLAAERTFLAWARTGLGFLGAGTGLFTAYASTPAETGRHYSMTSAYRILPACCALWANGAATLAFAISRYYSVAAALRHNKFPVGKRGLAGIIVSTAGSSSFALAWVARDGLAVDNV